VKNYRDLPYGFSFSLRSLLHMQSWYSSQGSEFNKTQFAWKATFLIGILAFTY
jgi:hypothetical protein